MLNEPPATGLWVPIEKDQGFPAAVLSEGAWVPPPLPSEVRLSSRTHQALARAEQTLGRLDEAADRLPVRGILESSTLLREAQSSAALENHHVALEELLVSRLRPAASASDIAPVVQYLTATKHTFATVREGTKIDLALLRKISELLASPSARDSLPEWRSDPTWVGGARPDAAVLLHVPPGPFLHAAAEAWQVWNTAEYDIPLVGKIGLGHHRLELIHPFAGGNGYVSRAYVNLELVAAGVLREPILPLSVWLDRNREAYYGSLRQVAVSGDYEEFLNFFAEGVRELCEEQIRHIKRMEELRGKHLALVNRSGGKAAEVASGLISEPITSNKDIAERYGMSRKGATDVARNLLGKGLLEDYNPRARRHKLYICREAMDLLALRDPAPPLTDRTVFGDDI